MRGTAAVRLAIAGAIVPQVAAVTGHPLKGALAAAAKSLIAMVETVGHKLMTHHPVIEPVSVQRRERNFNTQRQARKIRLFNRQRRMERRVGSVKAAISAALS